MASIVVYKIVSEPDGKKVEDRLLGMKEAMIV